MRSFVVDTDAGSDDAVALLLAIREPQVELRAITTVAGNVPIELAVRNALITLDVCGAPSVPVFAGASAPRERPLETAQLEHGADGMSGAPLPEPSRSAADGHAVDELLQIAEHEPGRHELMTLGPLTNIAAALDADPQFLDAFGHVWLMAGAPDGVGNVNALGEYNVWADPEAASIVLAASGRKTLIGWNISRLHAVITPDEQERLRACGPLGEFAIDINGDVHQYALATGLAGMDFPDPVAMAVAIDPSIILESSREWLVVGLDEPTRGCTFPDRRHGADPANIRVVWKVDEAAFKRRLFDACCA
ncbi:MAG: nucleoside hydrolase [Actinomycetota bacterium]